MPEVIPFRRNARAEDPIFFKCSDIHIGAKLRYFGRINGNRLFTITHITSAERSKRGNWYSVSTKQGRRDHDTVTIVYQSDARRIKLGYLSQSARWRLEE